MPTTLKDRKPQPTPAELVEGLVPPPRFSEVSLETYIANPEYPSQGEAVAKIREFAASLGKPQSKGGFFSRFSSKKAEPAMGLYLDGGFGVGKTHLLTSLYHLSPGRAVYGTFVEHTNLVGVLGYSQAVEEFANVTLLCIDEFELDDVGDTLLMTRLIRELSDRGVAIVATSNTLPRALGEGRFAAQDFLREIKAMADRFTVIRIDGEDYRRKERHVEPPTLDDDAVNESARAGGDGVTLDAFDGILDHLKAVHPSRYGVMVSDIERIHITGVHTLSDHQQALRLVVLIDRLYDRDVPIVYSGVSVAELFAPGLLSSGYSKKYYRCLSRLGSLAYDGASLVLEEARR